MDGHQLVEGVNSCLNSFQQNNTRFCLRALLSRNWQHVWSPGPRLLPLLNFRHADIPGAPTSPLQGRLLVRVALLERLLLKEKLLHGGQRWQDLRADRRGARIGKGHHF